MNNAEIAKCLAEVSALVAAGHPYEKCVQGRFSAAGERKYGYNAGWSRDTRPDWTNTDFEFRVAKGFVEGEPVFEGMTIWHKESESEYIVNQASPIWNNFTLTPPAPKVEIPEGFIEWHGGGCPVDEKVLVEVIFRSGESRIVVAGCFAWYHSCDNQESDDIIAYKIHKPTTFTLNGEVLPLPYRIGYNYNAGEFYIGIGTHYWSYKSRDDADKVRAAFAKLGEGL